MVAFNRFAIVRRVRGGVWVRQGNNWVRATRHKNHAGWVVYSIPGSLVSMSLSSLTLFGNVEHYNNWRKLR